MEVRNTLIEFNIIVDLILNRHVAEALKKLKAIATLQGDGGVLDSLTIHESNYQNILKYSFTSIVDPEREKIYKQLLVSLLECADRLMQVQIIGRINEHNSSLIKSFISGLYFREQLLDSYLNLFKNNLSSVNIDKDFNVDDLFNLLLHTDRFGEREKDLVTLVFQNTSISWYVKAQLIGAVSLSLQRYFDVAKFNILMDCVNEHENVIWHRALVALVIACIQYERRIELYPALLYRIMAYKGNNEIEKNVELIVIQILRARDTEKISRKFREEIIPEVEKLRPKITERMKLDDILSENMFEEENPEWQNFFQDTPGLYDKMEQISKLQQEGADVFITAFGQLKHFAFFNTLSNWHVPFYKDNQEVRQALVSIDPSKLNPFLEVMAASNMLCNSDKYSLCLNTALVPDVQRNMMFDVFKMEMQAMSELNEQDHLINTFSAAKEIYKTYIQDLYRFSNFYPNNSRFYNVFDKPFSLHNSLFLSYITDSENIKRNIAEYLFEKTYYAEAKLIYADLIKVKPEVELIEKCAYCYQKLKEYQTALDFYDQVALYSDLKVFHFKNMAYCYRRLRDYNSAIGLLQRIEKDYPDDLQNLVSLGYSLLDQDKYSEALAYFYKVEYLSPENHNVKRYIGRISFLMGKHDDALKYYHKLEEIGILKGSDCMNQAHVNWCLGNHSAALNSYQKAMALLGNKQFVAEIQTDEGHLLRQGIHKMDIPLLMDILLSPLQI